MNAEQLFTEMGRIDGRFVMEAETNCLPRRVSTRKAFKWTASVAACLVFSLLAVYFFPVPPDYSALPKLEAEYNVGFMGYEGYNAYDISDLANENPWTEKAKIESLPVFRNTVTYDRSGAPLSGGLSADEMKQRAAQLAALLNMTLIEVFSSPTDAYIQEGQEKGQEAGMSSAQIEQWAQENNIPYEATAVCKEGRVIAEINGSYRVYIKDDGNLPDSFRLESEKITSEEKATLAKYLLKEYGKFIDMKSPEIELTDVYTVNGDVYNDVQVFENSGNLTQKILGYNFNRMRFGMDTSYLLSEDRETMETSLMIICEKADLSQKIGEYPIITAQEARELLLQNHYVTSVPYDLPGEEYIAKVELVYSTGWSNAVFMPFYRFLVELPERAAFLDNGLKEFGAYYVPAVKAEFLNAFPLAGETDSVLPIGR